MKLEPRKSHAVRKREKIPVTRPEQARARSTTPPSFGTHTTIQPSTSAFNPHPSHPTPVQTTPNTHATMRATWPPAGELQVE
ncbi:uncharacterized protein EI90DRAFT_1477091 [Cantharellus anzutake]|uniref:uncharacterized protein n=1 Tax=Cantharellus anzutake TaxID=1750568 RepID=UPI0019063968|nr:uncharacterized protein EI90DRAFT_1477091 [Cantharellus anzutake]KAF8328795.1 hypothetical protein EI90DRAFT_1477091 [Cantharellus anzutake]